MRIVRDVVVETAKNLAMGLPWFRSWRMQRIRSHNFHARPDELAARLERYAFFGLRTLRAILGSVKDLSIVEIGPGDYLTSGFSLLAGGARSYTVVDRFVGDFSSADAKARYLEIEQAWPEFFPDEPWPAYLRADLFPEGYPDRLTIRPIAVEDLRSDRLHDVVCSFQVGEHVTDIEAFARANASLLAPGGVAVHRVDFGPHACWAEYPDPLTFMRFPDWLWRLMGSNRGFANRHRYHEFCAAWKRAGLTVEATGLEYWSEDVVRRARFAGKFRGMPLESLVVGTAVFICRKPALEEP